MRILFALIAVLAAASLQAVEIRQVVTDGCVRTECSIIAKHFEGKSALTEGELDVILRTLYASKLYQHVEMRYDIDTSVLRVIVVEQPVISAITIKGYDKIDLEDIEKVVDIKKNELIDLDKIQRNLQKIADLYKEKGYLMVRVVHDLTINEKNNDAALVLSITEGDRSRVRKISISGNAFLSDDFIKERLNTQEDGLFSFFKDEGYKKELLEEDQARIMFLYNEEGFVNVRVSRPIVTISPDRKDIYINFIVTEGERYKIRSVTVTGDLLEKGEYPKYDPRLTKDKWYRHSELIADLDALKTFYGDEGYPFVTVLPDRVPNEADKTLDVTYHIQKGNKCRVERIEITGNDRSRDKVIRREMRLYEGEWYTYTGQKRSEGLIKRTGFYDETTITLREGSTPELVRVIVKVKERKSGTFNVGAGFSSFESFVFNARIDQNNFLGYGQTISLVSQFSAIRQEVNLSLFEPYFFDYDVFMNTSFYFVKFDYSSLDSTYYADYEDNRLGYSLIFGYPITDNLSISGGYRIDKVWLKGGAKEQMSFMFRDMLTSSVLTRLTWDSRDDRMFPSKGLYSSVGIEMSPRIFGSDDDILTLDFNFRWYQRLFWDLIYKVNVTTGWKKDFSGNRLPVSERYRLGGLFSIRGYPYNSIGPGDGLRIIDDPGDPTSSVSPYTIGGDKQVIINNELELPILKEMRLNLVAFLDVGNAFNEDENLFYIDNKGHNKYGLPLAMYWSAGFGIRWVTPIAPLSFEWGFPITPRPGDPVYMFEFNIKNSF
ncbi:MAG TPA: outer membrane protein assembly factor BamA [bacterium]|nr:outer membrane protein assembly factor BamA [bacterium]